MRSGPERPLASCDSADAASYHLKNAGALSDNLDEGVKLLCVADELDDIELGGDINDLTAENVSEVHELGSDIRGARTALDEHNLALDIGAVSEVADLEDIHELVELLRDLLDLAVVAVGDNGDSRESGILGRCNGQGLDVVPALREETYDAAEGA